MREESTGLAGAAMDGQVVLGQRPWLADGARTGTREFAHILSEDPDLGSALPKADLGELTRELRAPVISVEEGPWRPLPCDPERTYGLLLLDGLLGRRLVLERAAFMELLGYGDILRPWQDPPESAFQPSVDWRVLSRVRLAVLDEQVTAVIGRRPELAIAFASRIVRRSQAAAHLAAIGHIKPVENRLLAVLWHLAENWGRVTPQGVRIPLRLTHEVLGELIGARRPSVTLGLRALRERGQVMRASDHTYLLTGAAPPAWPTAGLGASRPEPASPH